MSQPQLKKVTYEDKKGGIRLDCYTDTIVFDPAGGKGPQLVAIRFGGEPEKVRGLADAIYGGGTVEVEPDLKLDTLPKQYQRQLSHDGIYAEAILFLQDSEPETVEQEKAPQKQTRLEGPPLKRYIFCPQGDQDRLFSEIDRRTGVPLIPDFRDYLLAELQEQGILRKLEVISRTERFDAWLLTCTKNDKNIIQVVEDSLKSGKISIPGSTPENAAAFGDIQTVTGYLQRFGANIAQRIKGQFVPLFDPASEALSQSVLTVNENIRRKAGYPLYDAQLAAAEGLKRRLDRHEPALLVAECGSGKTKIGLTALTASHLAAGKKKTFNVVLCPSHITEKWVREVEETVPGAFAGIVTSIRDLKKLYRAYEKGDHTAYAILSKERARDGYLRAPAVRWSRRKGAFLCPHCHQPVMEEISEGRIRYEVPAEPIFFLRENTKNHKCRECGEVLWEPFCKPERFLCTMTPPSLSHEWAKIGGFGFVHRDFLWFYRNKTKSSQVLEALEDLSQNPEWFDTPAYGCRRFPISSFIKRKMKGKIDGLLADELHQYAQDSGQGDAMAEIAGTAKKVVGMTATLINGYASGIFHLLFRLTPAEMVADGQAYAAPKHFCYEYGVVESTFEVKDAEYNANRRASRTKKGERMLPGVSPLVYSRFLLENTVFLSLMDMGKDLPEYEEIPIGLAMRPEVEQEYKRLTEAFQSQMRSDRKTARKLLSAYLNTLTVYPDQPYGIPPVLDYDNRPLVIPMDTAQPEELHQKDMKTLELVRQKVEKGEKVLIYTSWVRIDTQQKLLGLLAQRGCRAAVLPANIEPIKRERWIEKQLANGLEVLICNPSLIETGLDANAFTTLIFYNMGYNLFTLRQASRRSWRINQTAPRVEVYFFYYKHTIQERAMQLMASKLAVAGIIEGNITDEGLAAMSNCQDMTSQLAKELVLGIKSEVEDIGAVFKKMAFLHPQGEERQLLPQKDLTSQQLQPVIVLPVAKQTEESEPSQPLTFITYSQLARRRKKAPAAPDENQLSFFEQIPARRPKEASMKFHIDRKQVLSAARKAAQAAPENSPIQELTGILVEADENTGQVSFFGADLKIAIRCEVQADVETGGSAIVNAQLLTGMLGLTSGDRVSVESLKNGLLRLKCRDTEYTIGTLKPDILTSVKILVPDTLVRLTGLHSLERSTTFAAAKKSEQKQMECVRIQVTKNAVQAVACDGSRLVETREKAESGGSLEFLLPAKSLRVLAGLVEDKETVYLGIQDHSAVFFRPGLYFTSRIVETPYLDVEPLLATPGKYRALAEAKALRQAAEMVAAASDGYSSLWLRFSSDKKIHLSCDGPNGSAANTYLETGVLEPMPGDTGFYYKASDFVQGIRLLEGTLALSVSGDGMLIATNGSEKYLLVPRRPAKRPEKVKAEKEQKEKAPAKKKTAKTKKTAAKAA